MIDWILAGIGLALSGGTVPDTGSNSTQTAELQGGGASVQVFEAEPQVPSGKFTTATEIKMIMQATKTNWVAVREFNGQDLVYVTHLLSWRCGMHQVRYSINDAPMQVWTLPPCLIDTAQPNAIRTEDGLPYQAFALGSVQSIAIEILYDDLSTDNARFDRAQVLMP